MYIDIFATIWSQFPNNPLYVALCMCIVYLLYNLVVRRYIVTISSQINSQSIYKIVDSSTNVYITLSYIYIIYLCKTYDLGSAHHQVRVTLWRLNLCLRLACGELRSLVLLVPPSYRHPQRLHIALWNTGGGATSSPGLGQLLIQLAFMDWLGQDHIQTWGIMTQWWVDKAISWVEIEEKTWDWKEGASWASYFLEQKRGLTLKVRQRKRLETAFTIGGLWSHITWNPDSFHRFIFDLSKGCQITNNRSSGQHILQQSCSDLKPHIKKVTMRNLHKPYWNMEVDQCYQMAVRSKII